MNVVETELDIGEQMRSMASAIPAEIVGAVVDTCTHEKVEQHDRRRIGTCNSAMPTKRSRLQRGMPSIFFDAGGKADMRTIDSYCVH